MTLRLYEGDRLRGSVKVIHTDKDGNVKRELHRFRLPGEGVIEVDLSANSEGQ